MREGKKMVDGLLQIDRLCRVVEWKKLLSDSIGQAYKFKFSDLRIWKLSMKSFRPERVKAEIGS
jgi:hypothetical protein